MLTRFLVRWVLRLLLLASLGLFTLYATTAYPVFAARIMEPNYGLELGQGFPLMPGRYTALRLGLAATAVVAAAGRAAGALLLAAAGVHLWYAFGYPLTLDEVASYDFAVLPGAALTASYYPFPNNHLLPNLQPGADAQLPTLLGLAVLGLGYRLLLRYLPFGVATMGWGLFSLSPLPSFYTVAGRSCGPA